MKPNPNLQLKLKEFDQPLIEGLRPLEKIYVTKRRGKRIIQCFCGAELDKSIVPHIRREHPEIWKEWKKIFVAMRDKKWSYRRIMNAFRANGKLLFSWSIIERELRKMEENGEADLKIWEKDSIEEWEPRNFEVQRTTVWNFARRGDWAVHQSDYRGNWPPQLVRNLISLYTEKEEWVVDLFAGGGTTLIEAWLMGRRSLGIDINEFAVKTTNARLEEMKTKAANSADVKLCANIEPIVVKSNSQEIDRILSKQGFQHGQVKLFCAHPPYLDALVYGYSKEGDLSRTSDVEKFCNAMHDIALTANPWLHDTGHFALLIGDTRKQSKLVPLGFRLLNEFIDAGYEIQEVIIKTQNQDQSTHLWASNGNLRFLIAHEYLFIFSKPH